MNLQLHLTDDTQLRAHGFIADHMLVAEVCWEHPIPAAVRARASSGARPS